MKLFPGLFSLSVTLLIAGVPTLRAQSTTTTETTTTVVTQPTPGVIVPVQPVPEPVAPVPGQHVAEIELVVTRGRLQAYFGRAASREKVELPGVSFSVKVPSTATVTKLANRDGDSAGAQHVTVDNPWRVTVPFNGPDRYVFNIVDWDNDPVVALASLKVDGVVLFSGRGSEDDFNGWAQKSYGPGVRKTGSREIAFVIPAE